MKILNIKSKKFKTFLKSIDLLDGQRKFEVLFRRVFFLVSIAMFIYLMLVTFVGKKEDVESSVVPEKAQAQERDKEEWINGDRVTTKADGSVEVVPAEVFMSAEQLRERDLNYQRAKKIETYLRVNRNNAPLADYAEKFVEVANKYGLDYRLLPAIAVMESGGGKSLFRSYNAWGYGKYSFNSFEEGIEIVGKGLKEGYIDKGRVTPAQIAPIYCPPNATNWARSVQKFMNEIESI